MAAAKISTPRNPLLVFRKFTLTLWLACLATSLLNVLFGYDTTSFGGVQAIPGFTAHFGNTVKKVTAPDGSVTRVNALSAGRASFMSSTAFIGKILGTLSIPMFIELVGHKYGILATCIVSFIGIIVECTSGPMGQFVAGRIIVYFSVGMAEVCVTTYQAEIVPAGARGAIVGTIQLFNQIGQIMAAGINQSFHKNRKPEGWIIPVACSAIAPFLLFFCVFFLPDGPRWLISKSRKEKAIKVLESVRDKADVQQGRPRLEANAIEEALDHKVEKGPWLDLFRGTNLRRTAIAGTIYVFQQITGQGFVTQYSPRFYATVNLSAHAFQYNIASATCGFAGCLIATFLIDRFGRRPLLLAGAAGQMICLFIIAAMGDLNHPSKNESNVLVASVMFFLFFYFGFWAGPSYVIGTEIGTAALREKTQSFTIALNVVGAWLTSFTMPYLLDRIGSDIGWVFGSIAFLSLVWTYFFVPELKGRSLEEMDELFAARVPARKFATTETFGAGRRVTELENAQDGEDISDAKTEGGEEVETSNISLEEKDARV